MVEYGDLKITAVFAKFQSGYVGDHDMIAGNAIYSALLHNNHITDKNDVMKVSHGIFHEIAYLTRPDGSEKNIARDHRGHPVSTKNGISQVSKIKTYRDFFMLRQYSPSYVPPDYDYMRIIRTHQARVMNEGTVTISHPHYVSFFLISSEDTSFNLNRGDELSFGAKRNLGFGAVGICDSHEFILDDLDYTMFGDDKRLINTAKSGICGVYNHKKYGFGEFYLNEWRKTGGWLVKLTTPLCLRSTMPGTMVHGGIPSFMSEDEYRQRVCSMWYKGTPHKLACADHGSVFAYV